MWRLVNGLLTSANAMLSTLVLVATGLQTQGSTGHSPAKLSSFLIEECALNQEQHLIEGIPLLIEDFWKVWPGVSGGWQVELLRR